MKFKIDENLPVELAQLLNQCKHNALTVFDQNLQGSDDPEIINICAQEGRILITLDEESNLFIRTPTPSRNSAHQRYRL